MYNEEDHDNLTENPCQNFLLFTCLILFIYIKTESILFIYKKTVVYKKHMQSRCSHLFGRLLFDNKTEAFQEYQKAFSLVGCPVSGLLRVFYQCVMRKVPARALRSIYSPLGCYLSNGANVAERLSGIRTAGEKYPYLYIHLCDYKQILPCVLFHFPPDQPFFFLAPVAAYKQIRFAVTGNI